MVPPSLTARCLVMAIRATVSCVVDVSTACATTRGVCGALPRTVTAGGAVYFFVLSRWLCTGAVAVARYPPLAAPVVPLCSSMPVLLVTRRRGGVIAVPATAACHCCSFSPFFLRVLDSWLTARARYRHSGHFQRYVGPPRDQFVTVEQFEKMEKSPTPQRETPRTSARRGHKL